jgi:type II restriction/modification system DNA methylase subunit YeeA
MNKAKLKTYAPQARKDFIAAVMARANLLGISEKNGKLEIVPSEKKGDVTLIAGQAWPAKVHEQRERLIKRMQKVGAGETAEAIAFTWFNRFAALRFMEIHDYLGHGHRVLSSREGGLPEILTHATELAGVLPGLNAQQIADMKLAGNKDGELYRLLLVAQCNTLSNAMPFLFERIDDESELLLPGNLERTDSVVAKLVEAIPEEDWNEVEVIGWLYQFYISEKKDEVIGKVVKSEDIPAATQLFTPNWIVQYLVQNSVGRLWLMANSSSSLKSQWPYYIDPAEQTPEVQVQLNALIKTRMDDDGGSLNPETITVLDPACGSGHILVEAYEVLKGIYLERGYQARAIPRLILEKNLYGLDIDDRAAQLAGFALLMKARADDRRLLETPVKLNVLSLQESAGMDLDEFAGHLKPHGVNRTVLGSLLDTFTHAKTFGSLIQIPKVLEDGLAGLEDGMAKAIENGDVFAKAAAQDLVPLVQQATILAMEFDAVAANPPYMGGKNMNPALKAYLKAKYPGYERDLFGAFIARLVDLANPVGFAGVMTSFTWMFISSFEKLRLMIIRERTIASLIQLEYDAFEDAKAHVCAFVVNKAHIDDFSASFIRLVNFKGAENQGPRTLDAIRNPTCGWMHTAKTTAFADIPGAPLAYWLSPHTISVLSNSDPLGKFASPRQGLATGENSQFVRQWTEVSFSKVGLGHDSREEASLSRKKWFPYNKGGERLKWYGNQIYLIDWEHDGKRLFEFRPKSVIRNPDTYFRGSLSWSKVTTGGFCLREYPPGFIYDVAGCCIFSENPVERTSIFGAMNSTVMTELFSGMSPTVNMEVGQVSNFPLPHAARNAPDVILNSVEKLVQLAKQNWDSREISWMFAGNPLISQVGKPTSIAGSWQIWSNMCRGYISQATELERANNDYYIRAYGVEGEVSSDVPQNQITLEVANRERDGQRLISYAIGCMMGRYSLDEPGLIYAHAGNVGFDATRYKTFPADTDGIIPITDELWFEDDAANRIREFLLAVWPAPTLDENMAWLAESLGTKGNETPAETIRRYLASSFFKDHLQTYKKRPIYWLFSSGKQGAFQALVYLHRYHEGTLARMRAEYVVPLTGKMQSRIEMLEKDKDAATSTAARNKIAKQIESLKKKHVELLAYDEKLRHYADMRISLDLDDGVKVNYGKFGDLLAEVKAVTGGANDD